MVSISYEMMERIFGRAGLYNPQPHGKWNQNETSMGFYTELSRLDLLKVDPKWQEFFDLLDAHDGNKE